VAAPLVPAGAEPTALSPRALRDAFGAFATGVTVVTAVRPDGEPVGVTANSFASVSLAPPLVLWSLANTSPSMAAFALGAPFAINILADGQRDLAMHFARSGKDKFEVDAAWRMNPEPPRLHGARARLDCRVHALHAGGDHTIIVGEVLAVARSTASPLLFADGKFGRYTLDAGAPAVNHWSGLHGEWI
jgi:flavin reductase (DIM6/NTAB) family NADH-FMN oxidoreductase RutF